MAKILFRVFVFFFALFCAWVALYPPPPPPTLATNVLGYTNDAAGGRLAMITVTNQCASSIFIYNPMVLEYDPADFENIKRKPTPFGGWSATLPAGASGTFEIATPTNRIPWKVMFYVYTDNAVPHVIRRYATFRRNHPFFLYSEWFEKENK